MGETLSSRGAGPLPTDRLFTRSTATLRRFAMSSTVSLLAEMIPTLLAMALAVMG